MSRARGALTARSISKSFGDTIILDRISLFITPGSRIGVVGPNGIGKSTLLRVLAGLEPPDSGTLSLEPPSLAVAYLAQEPEAADRSGGEAARAQLETILTSDADVLLLDEPTNDLDFAGLELLERFIDRHRGGLVAVSHDRAFLERMTKIVEFESETRRVREYAGRWSTFAAERDRSHERHQGAYKQYVDERGRIQEQARTMRQWEERGYGQGRKKKKSKDVGKRFEKKLDRLERVEKPWSPWRLELDITPSRRAGDVVARLERAIVAREGFQLGPIDLEVRNGDRLVVLGRNGAGKTTLLKALLGEISLTDGRRWIGPGVALGELPQGAGVFAGDRALLDLFLTESGLAAGAARSLLAKFALGADHVRRASGSLSPGERSRATLALLAARGVNTLVLDEPTNHLDLEAIEQLESALEQYDGTVILVTHDRRFLDAFRATRTLEL
ncbi:MAG: ABC-F family ATP-binding cassette domain-containing protein [Actinobacteria bacterium]|nr:ABC-F family ATP-binding cassette domain-containing protein [Actinomycetota bacterium]